MAIAYDNDASGSGWYGSGSRSITSFALGSGSNRYVLVFLYAAGSSQANVTYSNVQFNSVAMTYVGAVQQQESGGDWNSIEVYYMDEADLPSSGSYDFTCTSPGMYIGGAHIISFDGVAQESPEVTNSSYSLNGNDVNWSTAITTQTDGAWVVDALTAYTGTTSTYAENSGQTEISTSPNDFGWGNYGAGCSYELQPTAGSETQGWSWTTASNLVSHYLVSLAPAGAGPAAISYVDSTQSTSSGTTLTLTKPTGVQSGDLLLAYVVIEDDNPDVSWSSTPSGWTLLVSDFATGGTPQSPPKLYVYYKFAGGSEPSSYDWVADTSGAGLIGAMLAYRNVDATPFDATYTTATGSSGQPNPPSITTVTTGSWVLAAGFSDDNTGYTALSSGYNARETVTDASGGNGASLGVCDFATTGTGSQDPGAFSSGDSEEWGAVTIALQLDQGAPAAVDNAAIIGAMF